MANPDLPLCKDCVYFDEFVNRKTGFCRRYAPVSIKVSMNIKNNVSSWPSWPETKIDDWCGDGVRYVDWADEEEPAAPDFSA